MERCELDCNSSESYKDFHLDWVFATVEDLSANRMTVFRYSAVVLAMNRRVKAV
jgi:hypothetical protein